MFPSGVVSPVSDLGIRSVGDSGASIVIGIASGERDACPADHDDAVGDQSVVRPVLMPAVPDLGIGIEIGTSGHRDGSWRLDPNVTASRSSNT